MQYFIVAFFERNLGGESLKDEIAKLLDLDQSLWRTRKEWIMA